ncbi:MAG TPA: sigma-70 family RNA polymerase sigma factor [Vicinamibacteria bacterium]|nr:sigma-70 family RNA polymerase sigma factor [Vicinamibacteria bacterium]
MGDPESTFDLLERVRAGDSGALDTLLGRYLPRLRRWARGRLPRWARDMADTDDLVQETLLRSFKHMERFEARNEGSLQAYLRQAIVNRIRDEVRRRRRTPASAVLDSSQPDEAPSPLEAAIGREAMDRYDTALTRLRDEEREAIIGRVELGLSYQELAEALGKPSAEAARKTAERALLRLAQEMKAAGGAAQRRFEA